MSIADPFTILWYPAIFWDWYARDIPLQIIFMAWCGSERWVFIPSSPTLPFKVRVLCIPGWPRLNACPFCWDNRHVLPYLPPNDSFKGSCHQLTILLLPRVISCGSYTQEHAKESALPVVLSTRKFPQVSLSSFKSVNFMEFGEFHKLRQIRNPAHCLAHSRY